MAPKESRLGVACSQRHSRQQQKNRSFFIHWAMVRARVYDFKNWSIRTMKTTVAPFKIWKIENVDTTSHSSNYLPFRVSEFATKAFLCAIERAIHVQNHLQHSAKTTHETSSIYVGPGQLIDFQLNLLRCDAVTIAIYSQFGWRNALVGVGLCGCGL